MIPVKPKVNKPFMDGMGIDIGLSLFYLVSSPYGNCGTSDGPANSDWWIDLCV